MFKVADSWPAAGVVTSNIDAFGRRVEEQSIDGLLVLVACWNSPAIKEPIYEREQCSYASLFRRLYEYSRVGDFGDLLESADSISSGSAA
jgi:hypothetical protein